MAFARPSIKILSEFKVLESALMSVRAWFNAPSAVAGEVSPQIVKMDFGQRQELAHIIVQLPADMLHGAILNLVFSIKNFLFKLGLKGGFFEFVFLLTSLK